MKKNTVTQEQISAIMAASSIVTLKVGEKSTVVCVTLPSGFVIIESSSCVDPENYDHELGSNLCLKKIEDKIWMLEGYKLQCELAGKV